MKTLLVYVRLIFAKILSGSFLIIKFTFPSAGGIPTTTTTPITSTTTPITSTTTPISSTPTTPEGPFVCPAEGTYPYPGNCSLYYICTDIGVDPITVVSNFFVIVYF
jgi:hypothetical protein